MRQSKTIKSVFLFLSYCIVRLATTAESKQQKVAAMLSGALLALGIVFEANPAHAAFCISASACFLALLYMKSYYAVLLIYTILLSILLGLWTFCARVNRRMPLVVEMYFGALEWCLTLLAIACGIRMAMKSKLGIKGTLIPSLSIRA